MAADIHSSQIRNEFLKPITLYVEDEAPLELLLPVTKPLGAKEYAKLKRHVEAGKFVRGVEFSSGKVMHAIAAAFYNAVYLIDPGLTSIFQFERRPRAEFTREDREYERLEDRLVVPIKGTIHENVVAGRR
jgi:hypothetical protein